MLGVYIVFISRTPTKLTFFFLAKIVKTNTFWKLLIQFYNTWDICHFIHWNIKEKTKIMNLKDFEYPLFLFIKKLQV